MNSSVENLLLSKETLLVHYYYYYTSLFGVGAGHELIENVEGTFIFGLADGTGFLQKVSLNIGTRNVAGSIKIDANEFALHQEK